MPLKQLLRKSLKAARVRRMRKVVPDPVWAELLVTRNVKADDVQFCAATNSVVLREFDVPFGIDHHLFVVDGLYWARLLRDHAGAVFSTAEQGLHVNVGAIMAAPQTVQDLVVLSDIFVRRSYGMDCAKPVVIWDIGMNVGFAALFFATLNNVVAVRSFEPFRRTFQQAYINFSLNPLLARKIQPICRGIGALNERRSVPYSYEFKAQASVEKMKPPIRSTEQVTTEQIELASASEVLDGLIAEFPDIAIVAKMDCEGSEYDIIESLATTGRLERLQAVMIEWHYRGAGPLLGHLRRAGFFAVGSSELDGSCGMVYAVRL